MNRSYRTLGYLIYVQGQVREVWEVQLGNARQPIFVELEPLELGLFGQTQREVVG